MQRQTLTFLVAGLAMCAAGAVAQDGALAGVTMRVLDDISDIDAVILELEPAEADVPAAVIERRDAGAQEDRDVESPPPTPVP